jgi:hypothetical protein
VVRKAGLSIDDAAALKGTFSGVDGAFLLIPFDTKAPGSAQAENEMSDTDVRNPAARANLR